MYICIEREREIYIYIDTDVDLAAPIGWGAFKKGFGIL